MLSEPESIRRQVARICASGPFVNSERVSQFLNFVVDCALQGRQGELKESSIGVAVFDREPSYDPKSDPIVRVEARRLRSKLEQYYQEEGREDTILISVPKGGYQPQFSFQGELEVSNPTPSPTDEIPASRRPRRWIWLPIAAGAVVAIGIVLFMVLRAEQPITRRFWGLLFTRSRSTLIVPSDSALVILQNLTQQSVSLADYASGAYRAGLKSIDGLDQKTLFDLGSREYTLLPHLTFATSLMRRPDTMDANVRIAFCRTLRMDDLRDSNVILLGAVQGNPWVELFERNSNFTVGWDPQTKAHVIHNRTPIGSEPGEYKANFGDSQNRAYAIVHFTKNLNGDGYVLVVEGTTSAGNEAAGDFVLDDRKFGGFLRMISAGSRTIPGFEVLLQTTNIGNASPQAKVIAYRRYP